MGREAVLFSDPATRAAMLDSKPIDAVVALISSLFEEDAIARDFLFERLTVGELFELQRMDKRVERIIDKACALYMCGAVGSENVGDYYNGAA